VFFDQDSELYINGMDTDFESSLVFAVRSKYDPALGSCDSNNELKG